MPRSLSKKEIADFREQVCSAAEKIYQERGFAGITMRELATALNVSAMTPYRYFHDKNEIINLLRARAFQKFTSYMQIKKTASVHVNDYIKIIIANYISFEHEYPDKYDLMFMKADDISYKYLEDSINNAYTSLISDQKTGADTELGHVKADFVTRVIWSVLHGAKCLGEIGVEVRPGEAGNIPEIFTKFVLTGSAGTGR